MTEITNKTTEVDINTPRRSRYYGIRRQLTPDEIAEYTRLENPEFICGREPESWEKNQI